MAARGKWAQGIVPRNFTWIVQGRLAVCERPGGYGVNHRKVRRHEELLWVREQGFTTIISVVNAQHNLHNYDEMALPWKHRPLSAGDDQHAYLDAFFPELRSMLLAGEKVLIHQDELGDRVGGLMAAYILWNELVPGPPQAISIIEQLLHRQLGPGARSLVALVPKLTAPSDAPMSSPGDASEPAGAGVDAGDSEDAGESDRPEGDA